ncbi:MAG: MerR family transcriptional regulator [Caulobacterales bacterium]|nr:MerR family transcriptional regulator [Caulobacterales bacterium]
MAKGPHAFRTISEAADELGVPQHVLRFWESRFSFIRPMKRAGGRRFYRPQDIAVLAGVRALLHSEGYTIKGVQKLHKDFGLRRILAADPAAVTPDDDIGTEPPEDHIDDVLDEAPDDPATRPLTPEARERLTRALDDLTAVQSRLEALLQSDRGDH